MSNNKEFPLPQDGYLSFDSLGLKEALKLRLTENGIITDQAYVGSNTSQLIDIIAYTFNTLIYYLNRTSTESMFSDSQLYENINRIVKMIGYNPIGRQSSILTFSCSAEGDMNNGLYTIPRYSYINMGSISYSVNDDITFYKSVSGETEYLEDISKNKLLYQGRFVEYPLYNAIGDENEIVYLIPGDKIIIDHFNVYVYVKDVNDSTWYEWTRTNSLYLENSNDKKFEIRLNENLRYELKFGNNINGKKLNPNDQIAIYYLKSDGTTGEVGVNALLAGKLVKFNTTQFTEIFNDIQIETLTILPDNELTNLVLDNSSSSTYYSKEEDADTIRANSPASFRSQYRLVTESDFENFVKTNFSNLVHDVKVVNNWSYLSNYLKYFYDLGISDTNNVVRVLYNQLNFADSCKFNDVYIFVVPKTVSDAVNQISYLIHHLNH